MPSPTEITVSQLSRLIGTPKAPILIDVCIDEDFADDPRLIPGAFRHPASDIISLAPQLQGHAVVIICQKGLKMSQGAAALLRAQGISAETLEGGNYAWRDAGEPLIPLTSIPSLTPRGHTLWVTKMRPKIDRIACPWLIRRFIDPKAQFLFVSSSQVTNVAEKFGATPFDVDGVFWTHRQEKCTFDTMIEEFCLKTKPLLHLSQIIRGADTGNLDLSPQSAGLLAASLGLSRMYRDDLAQLEASMSLYDAFYHWSRDATDENHSSSLSPKRGSENG
jgi:rhodanese-related sulfurtransferase